MRTIPKDTPKIIVECQVCKFRDRMDHVGHQVGDLIRKYTGGGDYGFCRRCKRTNTLIVIEVPEAKPKKPEGWEKIPKS